MGGISGYSTATANGQRLSLTDEAAWTYPEEKVEPVVRLLRRRRDSVNEIGNQPNLVRERNQQVSVTTENAQ